MNKFVMGVFLLACTSPLTSQAESRRLGAIKYMHSFCSIQLFCDPALYTESDKVTLADLQGYGEVVGVSCFDEDVVAYMYKIRENGELAKSVKFASDRGFRSCLQGVVN